MTEGLAVADCIRSLQSLSTEEKVKDWAGRCVCTSLLWYTCHYELYHALYYTFIHPVSYAPGT